MTRLLLYYDSITRALPSDSISTTTTITTITTTITIIIIPQVRLPGRGAPVRVARHQARVSQTTIMCGESSRLVFSAIAAQPQPCAVV